jgi:signal recognition particle receptor subunit alpha
MIDQFAVFSKSGLVLWAKEKYQLNGAPVEKLVQSVLLEGRSSDAQFECDAYNVKWSFVNELDLVFVCVYQRLLQLLYIDELLEKVKARFLAEHPREHLLRFSASGRAPAPDFALDFDASFGAVLEEVELDQLQRRPRKMRGFQAKKTSRTKKRGEEPEKRLTKAERKAAKQQKENSGANDAAGPASSLDAPTLASGRRRMMRRFEKKERTKKKKPASDDAKKKKKMTTWNDAVGFDKSISQRDIDKLDRSAHRGGQAGDGVEKVDLGGSDMLKDEDGGAWSSSDEDAEADQDGAAARRGSGWGFMKAMGLFKGLSGNKVLARGDLDDALTAMREQLVENNVAQNIARELCDSVAATLVGQKVGTWTDLKGKVKAALGAAMTRLLTPKKSVDVLRAALQAKREGRPYTIVFIGVNGVGKSTSLSKVCYYLLQKQLSVKIAACDTFRSGAVEQLKVHGRRLGVEIFERGYAKDPAQVAAAAIREAKREGTDVVLIDTAGRMQNNTKLMKSLANLVAHNQPDLVLFVGEALVGNDGVDQLKFFNQALEDNSPAAQPRLIDGIVLTKFDTIDDKVGAALSMVYETGQPILFVGTGQKYTHLRRLNVQTVIKKLLRD